jgi:hypothetical protein
MIANINVDGQPTVIPFFVPQAYLLQSGSFLMHQESPTLFYQPFFLNQHTPMEFYASSNNGQPDEVVHQKPLIVADPEENEVSPTSPTKKNIRNIIPNIARKILSFVASGQSRELIGKLFP